MTDFEIDSQSVEMITALLRKCEWEKLSYGDLQKNLVLAQRGIGFILEDVYKQHENFENEKSNGFGSTKADSEAVQL
jgi:hypothetical protein